MPSTTWAACSRRAGLRVARLRQQALVQALLGAPDAVFAQRHGQGLAGVHGVLHALQGAYVLGQRPVHQHLGLALGLQAVEHALHARHLAAEHGLAELEHVVARDVEHGGLDLLPGQLARGVQQRELLYFLVCGQQVALHAVGKELQRALALLARGHALALGGQALGEPALLAAARIAAHSGVQLLAECFPTRMERGAGLPYVERVAYLAGLLKGIGVQRVDVADTIGVGTPRKVQRAIEATLQHFGIDDVSGHFHDTYGQALSNTLAALELGVWNFQSSVAGLGGCPYAKGATGNVATEDLVYMLHGMGIETGIDLDRLVDAGAYISDFLGRKPQSRVAVALLNKRAG